MNPHQRPPPPPVDHPLMVGTLLIEQVEADLAAGNAILSPPFSKTTRSLADGRLDHHQRRLDGQIAPRTCGSVANPQTSRQPLRNAFDNAIAYCHCTAFVLTIIKW